MGWDPMKIQLVREAFGRFRWPLAGFAASEIEVLTAGGARPASSVTPPRGAAFRPSKGWLGHVEAEALQAVR